MDTNAGCLSAASSPAFPLFPSIRHFFGYFVVGVDNKVTRSFSYETL